MGEAGVIFDMDGVIVLTEEAHWESWQAAARPRGVILEYATFLSCFGRVNPDCIRALFGPGISAAESASIADAKEIAFRDIIRSNVPLAPGIVDLLKELKSRGVRTAVGSSAPPENIALVLDAGKLRPMFDAVVDGSEVTRGKPAPDVFLMAAERMGVRPERCSVIEDAPMGIAAAVAAGMLAIGVATTHAAQELTTAGAKFVFHQPGDLISDRFFRAIGVME
ncbi:MAG: HAD family phosphatase [Tepidisphaeraceae bacterium]|jgi:beta-phosphoglucomutase family hydrolase